jgi:hypothetical protein
MYVYILASSNTDTHGDTRRPTDRRTHTGVNTRKNAAVGNAHTARSPPLPTLFVAFDHKLIIRFFLLLLLFSVCTRIHTHTHSDQIYVHVAGPFFFLSPAPPSTAVSYILYTPFFLINNFCCFVLFSYLLNLSQER